MAHHQASSKVAFSHGPENKGEYDGRERKAALCQDIAQDACKEHDKDVVEVGVDRKTADDTKHHDDGHQNLLGNVDDLYEILHVAQPEDEHHQVGKEEPCKEGVHRQGVLDEKLRSRSKVVHHERTEHDCGIRVAGDAERQKRDQGSAGGPIVRSLRGCDGFGNAGSKQFRVLGESLLHVVGDECADITTGTGDDTDEGSGNTGPDHGREDGKEVLHRDFCTFNIFRIDGIVGEQILDAEQALAHGEQSDQNRDEGEAVHQKDGSEGEAGEP